jgi:multiple sugar transport system substrate-binding protein
VPDISELEEPPVVPRTLKRLAAASQAAALALSLAACGKGSSTRSDSGTDESGVSTIKLWTHNAGNETELGAITAIVDDYNASQTRYRVEVQAFPQQSYNKAVSAAAASRSLPCIMDVDGPNVPNWAWAGYLAPLDPSLDATLDKFLPSTVGSYEGKNYAAGYYDVALVMEARKSALEKNGIRIPTIDEPWTKDEFMAGLEKITASGEFEFPLDLGTGATGEWWPYAYSPMLQSFGGDLIDRETLASADGVLNGPEAVEWATWFRSLVTKGYIPLKSGVDAHADFLNGKSAMLWNGSWAAVPARDSAIADDVLFLPPPDFGHGPTIGGGSWQWAVSAGCSNPEGAQDYMKFALQDKYIASVAAATLTIPTTEAAAAMVPGYEPGGENDIFRQYSQEFALIRPPTPGYPFIATTFTKAAQDILNGGDPQEVLDQAVSEIDNNQSGNNNFQ